MGREEDAIICGLLYGWGTVTGFQNGLAMAGDYMSAAAFLGITSAVMISGYDGMLYTIGSLVGWPVLVF